MNNKEIKTAILEILKSRINRENNGIFVHNNNTFRHMQTLRNNNIIINDYTVTQNDVIIYKIKRQYASRKINGMYKELMPKLEAVKHEILTV